MSTHKELPDGISFSPEFLSLYEFKRLLGRGAMGSVLLMRQVKMGRDVALKVVRSGSLTKDESARLEREAKALGAVNHQSIIAIYDVGRDGNTPYLVTEYVDGGSVAERLEKGPPLTLPQTLRIMIQVMAGLRAAHRRKIVHRDLKPANVFLTSTMKVKIGDFGLAKDHKAPDEAGKLTLTGTILGTPAYMSPEQCRGAAATEASDLYSAGVMLFEMIAGRRPFPGPDVLQYLLQHARQAPPSVREFRPDVPDALDGIIRRALEKDPGKRFPNAGAFRAELQAALKTLTRPDVTIASVVTVPEEQQGTDSAAEDHPEESGGRVLGGRYHLERLIGEGGMGQVWLAWDEELETSVAVKLLPPELWRDPEAQANLRQEAKHSAKLAHTNIVRLMTLQAGRDGEPSFLVMEYVSGPTLSAELARRKTADLGPFSPEEALPIIEGLAGGLEHAHQKSIIHRDIKPSNVLLEPLPDGSFIPKLADFGIAAEASSFRTRATGAMPSGTLAYMSPEQQACQKLDGRADLYSVAATLYQMLTYAPPFVGGNLAYAIVHAPVPRPENVPDRVAEFLMRALAKRREERPDSPRAFVAEYRVALGLDPGPWATASISAYTPRPAPGVSSIPPNEATPPTQIPIPETSHGRTDPPTVRHSGQEPKPPEPAPPQRSRAPAMLAGAAVLGLVAIGVVESDRLGAWLAILTGGQQDPVAVVTPATVAPPSTSSPPPPPSSPPPSVASVRPVVRATPSAPATPSAAAPTRVLRLKADADGGNVKAQLELAALYEGGGEGLAKDERAAGQYYRRAADAGNAAAQAALGRMYLSGRGVKKDVLLAADWFRKAATQEDASALWSLAELLMTKQVVPRGEESETSLLTRAAARGDARAQAVLGGIFANGRGVPRNDQLALSYYRKAAEQGNARGQCGVGFMYDRGRGVKADPAEAFKWYTLAANQQDPAAMMNLGLCYRRGAGVAEDEAKAVEWLTKAVEGGHLAAELVLAEVHFNGTQPDHHVQALKWYERAAHRGNRDAQYLLAMMLAEGLGTKADAKAAAVWCDAARKLGHPDAERWLEAEARRVSAPGAARGP